MKSLCALFLILVGISWVVSAQNPVNSKPEAKMIDDFGLINLEEFEVRLEAFLVELQREPSAQGYIINYGSDKEVSGNELIIRNYYSRRKADIRISFVRGRLLKEGKTQFWLIPPGAEPPKLIPATKIFAEIGIETNQKIKKLMEEFDNALRNEPTATGYIINYGRALDVARREKQIRNSINFRRYDADRIIIVNSGRAKTLKTVFWIVPQGTEPPTP